MTYDIRLHPNVDKFLDNLNESERARCLQNLDTLKENPFISRSGTDIKKLKGKLHDLYRLRIGDFRFEYFVESNTIWIVRGFRRGKDY